MSRGRRPGRGQVVIDVVAALAALLAIGSVSLVVPPRPPGLHRRATLRVGPLRHRPLAISPDGSTLATLSAEQSIDLWDLPPGRHRRRLGLQAHTYFPAFSPEGRFLVTSDDSPEITLWDLPAMR